MYPMLPDSSVEGICSNRRRTSANTSKHMSMPRIGMSVFLAIQVLIHVRDAQHGACCNRLKTHIMFVVESTWHFESKMGCWFSVRFKGSGFPTWCSECQKTSLTKKIARIIQATLDPSPREKTSPLPIWVSSVVTSRTRPSDQKRRVERCSVVSGGWLFYQSEPLFGTCIGEQIEGWLFGD